MTDHTEIVKGGVVLGCGPFSNTECMTDFVATSAAEWERNRIAE